MPRIWVELQLNAAAIFKAIPHTTITKSKGFLITRDTQNFGFQVEHQGQTVWIPDSTVSCAKYTDDPKLAEDYERGSQKKVAAK